MNAIKYIGMDVQVATSSIAVLDAQGKLMMEATIATQAGVLLDFIRGWRRLQVLGVCEPAGTD